MPVDDKLIDRFLDGEVSDDEKALVIEWLDSDANLQHFARRAELHADLRSTLRRRGIQDSALETCEPKTIAAGSESRANAVGSRPRKLIFVAIATAAILLFAFGIWPTDPQPDSAQKQLATIVSEVDALLTGGDTNRKRETLVAGDYQLQRGLLNLRFHGGVMVYVEAPAEFNIFSGKRLVLKHGRLSASVPPEGVGFTVDTPEAKVVDFGTEFSVDVASGSSEVHVFDGLVRVHPKATQSGKQHSSRDLRTSQAVKIDGGDEAPVDIQIARDRFIRNFDEPKRKYSRTLRALSPLAIYRMGIRDQGLRSVPPEFSGEVLIGSGVRPPHARGVFAGGALRVGANSTGRGGRVLHPPKLTTGQFSLLAFVYLDSETASGIIATNQTDAKGNFTLSIDQNACSKIQMRGSDHNLVTIVGHNCLKPETWKHIVVTANEQQLRLYEDGQLTGAEPFKGVATSTRDAFWFGTDPAGQQTWNGRIDEVALFDKPLTDSQIAELYQSALEEIASAQ